MTERDDRLLLVNAALDGELDAMGSLAFERELHDDPAIAAEYQRLTKLRDAVRRHAPREAAPQALADRIAAMAASSAAAPPPQAAAPTATVVPFRRRAWLDSRALAMAASLGVLGFAVGAGLTSLRRPAGSGDVAQHLVSDFARAEIAGQPFDVASSDRHTVKPWLADRTTISGTIVDLAPQGFPLVGGRVAVIDRIPTPTLVYRHNEHLVAVTELPRDAKGVRAAGGIETIDGYHVARWADANLAYVAVSDMDENALGEFVAGVPSWGRGCDRARAPLRADCVWGRRLPTPPPPSSGRSPSPAPRGRISAGRPTLSILPCRHRRRKDAYLSTGYRRAVGTGSPTAIRERP